jgi:hypothetical protein
MPSNRRCEPASEADVAAQPAGATAHAWSVHELGDELIVFDPRTDTTLRLNRTAARVWRLAMAGLRPVQIAEQMQREFDVDDARALGDVLTATDRLIELRLLPGGSQR